MKREDKNQVIEQLATTLTEAKNFYIADIGGLDADQTSALRRSCFKQDVKLMVVKNTLLRKAMEKAEGNFDELYPILAGPTSLMISDVGNKPARMIKEFRKKMERPILKGAFVEEGIYIGDDQLDTLVAVKSKEELLGDLIALLQSPLRNVLHSLDSGKNILAGVVKTLSERES